jgi:hypothetical protein
MKMLKANLFSLCLFVAAATLALADDPFNGQFKANLTGYNEVPAVLTTGSGQVTVAASSDRTALNVTLNFNKLVGVAQSASLYLGSSGTTGGTVALLCGGTAPACPATANGTVTITLSASDVLAIPAQGLAAGDLAGAIQAWANGAIYVNVITSKFASGEIRGQVSHGFFVGNFGRGE